MKRTQPILDVLFIGGDTVVLFDSGYYPDGAAKYIHTVLTWGHKDRNDFRIAARENITLRDIAIEKPSKAEDGYLKAINKLGI